MISISTRHKFPCILLIPVQLNSNFTCFANCSHFAHTLLGLAPPGCSQLFSDLPAPLLASTLTLTREFHVLAGTD